MRIIDISIPIHEKMVVYPGNTPVILNKQFDMKKDDALNVTDICCSTHTGTHVDSPRHHFMNEPCIVEIGTEGLVGKALVFDATNASPAVTRLDIQEIVEMKPFDILLLKTKNSLNPKAQSEFDENHIYLSTDAAEFLVNNNIKGVGIDCLSVEKYKNKNGSETHKILMKKNAVVIIEGVNLTNVDPGYYFCACLPIPIENSDGAPARTILIPYEDLKNL
jgi:arylformamidase